MKPHVVVAVLAFASSVAAAQKAPKYPECQQTAMTQTDMNLCAGEGLRMADADLDAVYQKMLTRRAGDPVAIKKLRTAERAWIVYRDAYLEAVYPAENKQLEYGSIYPLEYSQMRRDLTQTHMKALSAMDKDGPPGQH